MGRGVAVQGTGSTVLVGPGEPCRAIGGRINPTGRPALAAAIQQGRWELLQEEARRQQAAGAELLDVNVGAADVDPAWAQAEAVRAIQAVCPLPLLLDAVSVEALAGGLRAARGRPLVNSADARRARLIPVLELARDHDAPVVALTLDDAGVPGTAEGRLRIAERIVEAAVQVGLPPERLLVDVIALPLGRAPEGVAVTLETAALVREKLGLATLLGVSNISYGQVERGPLNAAFVAMAVMAGVDAVILNPLERTAMGVLRAANALAGRTPPGPGREAMGS